MASGTDPSPSAYGWLRQFTVQSPWDGYQPKSFVHPDDVAQIRARAEKLATALQEIRDDDLLAGPTIRETARRALADWEGCSDD